MPGPEKGSIPLDSKSLEEATDAMLNSFQIIGVSPPARRVAESIARRTIRAYLANLKQNKVQNNRISPLTLLLTEMQVGEVLEFPPAAPQIYRARMKSARKVMDNPDAKWVCSTEGGRMFIKRLPDFSRPMRDPTMNKKAMFLASVKREDGWVKSPFEHRRKVATNTKITARRILIDDYADWSVQTRRDGVYVRRVK